MSSKELSIARIVGKYTFNFQNTTLMNCLPDDDDQLKYLKGCSLSCNRVLAIIVRKLYDTRSRWFYILTKIMVLVISVTIILIVKRPNERIPVLDMNLERYGNSYTMIDGTSKFRDNFQDLLPDNSEIINFAGMEELSQVSKKVLISFIFTPINILGKTHHLHGQTNNRSQI